MLWILITKILQLQSTLVILNSLISDNRLSRSENLVPVLIQRSTNRQQNIVEKRRNCSSFPQYFQYISNLGIKLHIHSVKGGCSINFPQFHKSDMSKYRYLECFIESLGVQDNESRLYSLAKTSKLTHTFTKLMPINTLSGIFFFTFTVYFCRVLPVPLLSLTIM